MKENGKKRKRPSLNTNTNEDKKPPIRKYERKTPRFVWPDELHRLFIASIFELGMKHATPKELHGWMLDHSEHSGLTTEHLKSHLQKYRSNYKRSKQEFLDLYQQSMSETSSRFPATKDHASLMLATFPVSKQKLGKRSVHPSKLDTAVAAEVNMGENLDVHAISQRKIQLQLEQQRLVQQQLQESIAKIQTNALTSNVKPANVESSNFHPGMINTMSGWGSMVGYMPPSANDSYHQVQHQAQHEMSMAMQSQMNLHRQMLARQQELAKHQHSKDSMEDSLYPFQAVPPNSNTQFPDSLALLDADGWDHVSLDFESVDEDIFSFLKS